MLKKILKNSAKVAIYLVVVGFAIVYTPRFLSRALHTQYPLATITSGSMWPTLKANDLIFMKGINGNEAEVGQIIIFKNPKGFTIHRLVRKQNGLLITRGDANNIDDKPIKPEDVIGRAVYVGEKPFRIPHLGALARNLGPKLPNVEKISASIQEIIQE